VSCPARERSNTPVQALTLLNDPLYVEFAHGLAKRMAEQISAEPAARIDFAFRVALARAPDAAESAALQRLYERTRKLYSADKTADAAEFAAWTAVARTI